jgi:hypothetical protein
VCVHVSKSRLKIRVSLVQILVQAPVNQRGDSFLAVAPFFVYGPSMVPEQNFLPMDKF